MSQDLIAPVRKELTNNPPQQAVAAPNLYLLGVKRDSDCPRQVVVVGGVDFPLFTEVVEKLDGSTQTTHTRRYGAQKTLYPEQVEKILVAIRSLVFRGRRLLNTTSKHYVRNHTDVPLANYLYMQKLAATDQLAPEVKQDVFKLESAKKSEQIARTTDLADEARRKYAKTLKAVGGVGLDKA